MGTLFRSFDEAWESFLSRAEPMETLPAFDAPSTLVWLVPVDKGLVPRVRELQARLACAPFVRVIPEHFLHVTVAVPPAGAVQDHVAAAERAWRDVAAFPIDIRRVNCFHEAVVAEVAAMPWDLPEQLLGRPLDHVLPHVTLALTDGGSPDVLREIVVPLREAAVGRQLVTHVDLCRVPTKPESFLQPWEVLSRVALRN
jgi:hypothetical protein